MRQITLYSDIAVMPVLFVETELMFVTVSSSMLTSLFPLGVTPLVQMHLERLLAFHLIYLFYLHRHR
jgi:hypothetical protein